MKNICFFIGNISNSGGTERVTSLIANALSERNYNVSILSLYGNSPPYFLLNKNIKNDSLFKKKVNMKLNYMSCIYKLRRFVKNNNIDVLVNVDSILCMFSVPSLFNLKVTHICWEHFNFHSNLGSSLRVWGRKLAASYCDYIVTLTQKDKDLWKSNLKKIRAQIIVINNPSPYQKILSTPSLSHKTVLSIGRLTDQKGFDILLNSWAKFHPKNPEWSLIIVGNGEKKNDLLKQIRELNIQNSVEIHAATTKITDYYQQASFYCLSSRFEGFPMVLLEAQSYGLPIVAFDCQTGPAEIISNNISGYLVEPLNTTELSVAIHKMANISPEKYNSMSFNSLTSSQRYTIENIIPKWIDIVEA